MKKINILLLALMTMFVTTSLSYAQTVIDISDSDDPSILKTTLGTAEDGATIVLKRGMTYDLTSTGLSKSVKIMSAAGDGDPAILDMASSSLDIVSGSSISSLDFVDVEISGDIDGGYLMNFSTEGSIGDFTLDSVYIHHLRGIYRCKDAGVKNTGTFSILNSMVDSIGGYGVMIMDNANASCADVNFTNSVFTNVNRVLRWRGGPDANAVVIDQCSFYSTPYDGDFIRVENAITNGVSITNSILGASNNKLVNGTATVNAASSYKTSDSGLDGFAEAPMDYAGTSDDLFTDPVNGDLSYKDASFEGAMTVGAPQFLASTFEPDPSMMYNIVQVVSGNTLGEGSSATQPGVVTLSDKASQAFMFMAVDGKDNTYLIQNHAGMYLSKAGTNNWTTAFTEAPNGTLSEWVVSGTDMASIRLQVVDNIDAIGAERSYLASDATDSGSSVYCDKASDNANGEFMLQEATVTYSVAYVTYDKAMDENASPVTEDPIIKMLEADENISLTVLVVAADADLGDLSMYDAVVVQEGFGSGSAILKQGASLGLASIPVPFLYNKMYGLRSGRALSSGSGASNESASLSLMVDPANQANDLFKSITFEGDTFMVFRNTYDDSGAPGGKSLNYNTGNVISTENTLLGAPAGVTDAVFGINDLPAGTIIDSDTIMARMIAVGFNFGAISGNKGTNFTSEGLTLWRNAVYSLVGLDVPEEMVMAPAAAAIMTHSYTFEEAGSAVDVISGADGTINGGMVKDGMFTAAANGEFITLPAADIAINTYDAITIEGYITADVDNTGATMMAYFGGDENGVGGNGYFFTPDRWSESRTGMSTGNLTAPWENEDGVTGAPVAVGEQHHIVSVLTNDSIKLYINGALIGTSALRDGNIIANLSNANAWIAKGGYTADPTWMGSISEFNIYEGELTAEEVAANSEMWPEDQVTTRKVAYITESKDMESSNQPGNDPIIQLMSQDENFDLDVLVVANDSLIDLSGYDLVVGQEPFGSGSDIWQPGGTLALENIPVPFIYNKAYALRHERAITDTSSTKPAAVDPGFMPALMVSTENQANSLFSGITFEGDSVVLFNEGANDTGGDGEKAMQYVTNLDIVSDGGAALENTMLGLINGVIDTAAQVCVNIIPAGTRIGDQDTLKAQMIAISQNYGAICKDGNMTDANYTLWRNAFYIAAGLDVPEDGIETAVEIEVTVPDAIVATDNEGAGVQVTVPMGTTSVALDVEVISGLSATVPTVEGLSDGTTTNYDLTVYAVGGDSVVYNVAVHVQAEEEILYLSASNGVYSSARAFDTNIYDGLVDAGYSVTLLRRGGIFEWSPEGINAFDYTPYAGMVISAGEGSSNVDDFAKRNYPIPCVTMQPDGPRSNKWGWVGTSGDDDTEMNVTKDYDATTAQIQITNTDHPITAGYEMDQVVTWTLGTPDSTDWSGAEVKSYNLTDSIPEAIALATIPADGSSLTTLWAVPAGTSVRSLNVEYGNYERVTTASNVVVMSVFNDGWLYAGPEGIELLVNSLKWTMGVSIEATKVAYVTSGAVADPISDMLSSDPNLAVDVVDGTGDYSDYDVVIGQESFGSSDAIWSDGGALYLKNEVPMLMNKTFAWASGKAAVTSSGTVGRIPDVSVTVDPANQDNELFNGITFADNSINLWAAPIDGEIGLDVMLGIEISDPNTLLASASNVTDPAMSIVLNDIPAGTQIGTNVEDVTGARIIAFSMNYLSLTDSSNVSSETMTLWRNAVYMLAGMTPPDELVVNPHYVPVSVNDVEIASGVTVYPNPAREFARVAFTMTESAQVQLSVYNTLGQKVQSNTAQNLNAGENMINLNTSNLNNGIYIYQLEVGDNTYNGKFYISK